MEPDRGRAQAPSLLAGNPTRTTGPAAGGILADLESGKRPVSGRRPRPQTRRLWVAVTFAGCAVLAALWWAAAPPTGPARPAAEGAAGPGVSPAPLTASPAVTADAGGSGAGVPTLSRTAMILDEPPPPPPLLRADAETVPDPDVPLRDPLQQLFAGSTEPAAATPPAPVRPRAAPPPERSVGDADVDLIAALMNHAGRREAQTGQLPIAAERGSAEPDATPAEVVTARLSSCPPANTAAGLSCRQRVCVGHWGHPACPNPAGTLSASD